MHLERSEPNILGDNFEIIEKKKIDNGGEELFPEIVKNLQLLAQEIPAPDEDLKEAILKRVFQEIDSEFS